MYKHKTEIRVRYAETDRMGVVYYANYLVWFEVARTEYLKSKGVSYRLMEESEGIFLMVAESRCRHLSPTTYDDTVTVETCLSSMKNASMTFRYDVFAGGKLAASGETVHVCTDRNRRPVKIPVSLKEKLAG